MHLKRDDQLQEQYYKFFEGYKVIENLQLLFSIANIGEDLKGIVGHEEVKKELLALAEEASPLNEV